MIQREEVIFDEESHTYFICGKKVGGSVTQFVHSFFSDFNAEEVINKYIKKWHSDPYSQYYKKSKEEILQIWDKERDLGTDLHAAIEDFYNGLKEGKVFINVSKEIEKDFNMFLQFDEQKGDCLIPYLCEFRVYDLDLDLAGSIDKLYKKTNGKYAIYDWKRTKSINYKAYTCGKYPLIDIPDSNFWHYSLQLNMYKYILEKNYGIEVDEMCLVQIHPNQDSYKLHPVADLQNFIKQMIKVKNEKVC